MVCYAGKQETPFWFSSLDQIVQFGAIIFCRTFRNYFGQFVWIEKKVPLFNFFGTARLFFGKKISPKGSPFNFLMFCDRMDVEKPQRVPPFSFSAFWDVFSQNYVLSKGSPLNFFNFLQQIGCLKIPKGPPFQFFDIVRLLFENLFFLQRVPLQLRRKCWQFRKCPPFSAPGARASGPRRANRSIFLVFWFSSTVNWHLEVFLLILSLRYGADMDRSRLVVHVFWFCSQLWGPTEATFLSWVLSCEIFQVSLAECLQNFNIKTSVFSFYKLCLQFGTEADVFGCVFRFFLDLVPVFFSVILDLILEVLPVVLDLLLMFSIFSDVIIVVSFVFHMIQSDFMPTII